MFLDQLCLTMTPLVEVATARATLGEGPHWDVASQCLYYVDIFGRAIHKYVPSTDTHTSAKINEGTISFVIPVDKKKDHFLVGIGLKVALVKWDGESDKVSCLEYLTQVDSELPENRINDAKCDPAGRLWLGTMGPEPEIGKLEPEKGTLYTLVGSNKTKKHLTKVSISNGLAWNIHAGKMYYIDSPLRTIDSYDYDPSKGTMSNKKAIFDLDDYDIPGVPDGMTIDNEGKLWVAVFNGSRILRIDPDTSELLSTVHMPVKQVTAVAFGGPKLDVLYATSARLVVDGKSQEEPAGAVFKITNTGAVGLPSYSAKI